jgi:hypothetical protein
MTTLARSARLPAFHGLNRGLQGIGHAVNNSWVWARCRSVEMILESDSGGPGRGSTPLKLRHLDSLDEHHLARARPAIAARERCAHVCAVVTDAIDENSRQVYYLSHT